MEDQVQQTKQELAVDTFGAWKNLDEIMAFGKKVIDSGLSPLKKPQDVVAAILFGRELGMPPMVSINNIYPINGKGTLSVHMINALLQKNGVVVEVIKNYEPVVAFVLKEEGSDKAALFDKTGRPVKRLATGEAPAESIPMVLREGFADESPKDHEVKGSRILGYRTVLKFTRKIKQPDNTWRDMIVESSYSTMEAYQANLMGNEKKENWVKYPKPMTLNRALAFGGRLVGADIMLGMYETSEMADANNMPYKIIDVDHIEVIEPQPKATTSETQEDKGETSKVAE